MGPRTDDFRDAIRRARRMKGWTQQQLADAVDVHLRTVSNWETGQARPGESTLRRIAQALDMPEPDHEAPMNEARMRLRRDPDMVDRLRRVSRELGYVQGLVDDLVDDLTRPEPPPMPTVG